jgi:hypothetical protein
MRYRRRGYYRRYRRGWGGLPFIIFIIIFASLHSALGLMIGTGALILAFFIIQALLRSTGGLGGFGSSMNNQNQQYYQPPAEQPNQEQEPTYQPYEQGYQPPSTPYQGSKQQQYPQPKYDYEEQPQAQYPQELPPMEQ